MIEMVDPQISVHHIVPSLQERLFRRGPSARIGTRSCPTAPSQEHTGHQKRGRPYSASFHQFPLMNVVVERSTELLVLPLPRLKYSFKADFGLFQNGL
jgi:hypothetical protein